MASRHIPNDAPITTIGQLAAREPRWVRLYCDTPGCGHHAPVALVPLLLRWGPAAPRSLMLTRFRCSRCGRRNTSIRAPSMMSFHGPEPFPAVEAAPSDPGEKINTPS